MDDTVTVTADSENHPPHLRNETPAFLSSTIYSGKIESKKCASWFSLGEIILFLVSFLVSFFKIMLFTR